MEKKEEEVLPRCLDDSGERAVTIRSAKVFRKIYEALSDPADKLMLLNERELEVQRAAGEQISILGDCAAFVSAERGRLRKEVEHNNEREDQTRERLRKFGIEMAD